MRKCELKGCCLRFINTISIRKLDQEIQRVSQDFKYNIFTHFFNNLLWVGALSY